MTPAELLNAAFASKRMASFVRKSKLPLVVNGTQITSIHLASAADIQRDKCLEEFVKTASPGEIVQNAYRIANCLRRR